MGSKTQEAAGHWLEIKQNKELIGTKAVQSANLYQSWEQARKARGPGSIDGERQEQGLREKAWEVREPIEGRLGNCS